MRHPDRVRRKVHGPGTAANPAHLALLVSDVDTRAVGTQDPGFAAAAPPTSTVVTACRRTLRAFVADVTRWEPTVSLAYVGGATTADVEEHWRGLYAGRYQPTHGC
jgi:hypothetical protein